MTRVEVAGRRLQADQPRQGDVPLDRDDQGRGARTTTRRSPPCSCRTSIDRPVTRVRWPHGVGDQSFFEKNLPSGAPSGCRRCRVDDVTYPLVGDLADADLPGQPQLASSSTCPSGPSTTTAARQQPRPARHRPRPRHAGRAARVRPGGAARARPAGRTRAGDVPGDQRQQGHAAVRRRSAATSTSDQVRDLAQQLAQELTKKHPDLMLWKMTKSLRPGKVFLDWSQNVAAKTTIAPTPCAVGSADLRRAPRDLGRGRGRRARARCAAPADVRRGARAPRTRRRPARGAAQRLSPAPGERRSLGQPSHSWASGSV